MGYYTELNATAASNNSAPPIGAPEGMLPSTVDDTMREMMSTIRTLGDGTHANLALTLSGPVTLTQAQANALSFTFTGIGAVVTWPIATTLGFFIVQNLCSGPVTCTLGSGNTVIVPSGTIRALWTNGINIAAVDRSWPFINVCDHGADPSGVTQSDAALNTAITDATNLGGGVVYFPPGSYALAGPFNITIDGVRICGAGKQATVLNFAARATDCFQVTGTISDLVTGFELSDLTINVGTVTGGYVVNMQYVNYGWVRRVSINNAYNGITFNIANYCGVEDTEIFNCIGNNAAIYWKAPGNGSAGSTGLEIRNVRATCSYLCNGLGVDGWCNDLHVEGLVVEQGVTLLDVSNIAVSNTFYPYDLHFMNCRFNGATFAACYIGGGNNVFFANCDFQNASGAAGQGGADSAVVQVQPDISGSVTRAISFVGCQIGNGREWGLYIAGKDVSVIGCTVWAGALSASNTWPAIEIASPAQECVIVGCKSSIYGASGTWKYGLQIDAGTLRTKAVGNAFTVSVGTAQYANNSGDAGTFVEIAAAKDHNQTSGSPAGTTSTTLVYAGLSLAISPKVTGVYQIVASGEMSNDTSGDSVRAQLFLSTTPTTNGAAATGAQAGTLVTYTAANSTTDISAPFPLTALLTGLSVGTTQYVDIAFEAVTGGTASLINVTLTAVEI